MTGMQERLIEEALSLPLEARARLVELLLESLNPPLREDLDKQWGEEAERRVEDVRSGRVQPIPREEVFDQILRRHQR